MKNPDKINWYFLSTNKNAIQLLEANRDKVNWCQLMKYKNAIHLITKNPNRILWCELCKNKNAADIILKNLDKIDISYLLLNFNKKIINYIKSNIKLLKSINYFRSYTWSLLSKNPSIFILDYEAMKKNNERLEEDLIKEVMKPSRVFKNPDYDYIEELFE